jgi:hypothetical protein
MTPLARFGEKSLCGVGTRRWAPRLGIHLHDTANRAGEAPSPVSFDQRGLMAGAGLQGSKITRIAR